jgi:hypothetical protein
MSDDDFYRCKTPTSSLVSIGTKLTFFEDPSDTTGSSIENCDISD